MIDYKKFADDLGLADEDKTALLALFEKKPDVVGKVESFLDTQVQAKLTPLQTELATKQKDLDAQFETLASIRGGDEQAIAAAEKKIETLASQSAILQERLRRVATDAGLNAEDILKDLSLETKPVVKPTVETPAFDSAKFLGEANRAALSAFENAALMEDLAQEHQTLFGKPMSRVELIAALKDTVKRTGNPNIGLRDIFEQKFNVTAKREEIREADVQRRIADAVKARETSLNDEFALRQTQQGVPQRPAEERSPILATLQDKDKPAHIGGLPEAVVASIADYRKRMSERKAS